MARGSAEPPSLEAKGTGMKRTRLTTRTVVGLACLCGVAASGWAQEHAGPEPGTEEAHAAHGPAEAHEAHAEGHPKNFLGIVLGGTYESEEEDTYFTMGGEYERLLSPRFALVLGVEYITEVDAWIAFVPFVYRHGSGWRLLTGPGIELKTRRPEPEREHGGELGIAGEIGERLPGKEENLFLWRFGVAYNFTLGERYAIAPAVDLDLVREDGHWVEALVFTVSFGFDF
jgi:hypothetical protein